MADYRRAHQPGGTFFFTLVTENRAPFLTSDAARQLLHQCIESCIRTKPFTMEAIVLLSHHLHSIWTLPPNDTDFSSRWALIKATFTRKWILAGGAEQHRTGARLHARRRGVWQRRFWEHCIHDEDDFARHLDYLHYNPVKHGFARCPHE
jgi:putative transposase